MQRSIRARRWLTLPVAALTVLSISAFGGDDKGGGKTKDRDGKTLFTDDFVDDGNGWGGESTPEYEVTVNAESETFDMVVTEDPGHLLEWFPDSFLSRMEKLRDVRIDADVSFTSPGAAAIECRVADPSGESGEFSSYVFVAHPDGNVAIHKQLPDGQVERLAGTADSGGPVFDGPATAEDFVTIGAQCQGGKGKKPVRLTMFADGEKVLSTKDADDPYRTGGFMLTGAKSSAAIEEEGFQPFAVVWDSVEVTEL